MLHPKSPGSRLGVAWHREARALCLRHMTQPPGRPPGPWAASRRVWLWNHEGEGEGEGTPPPRGGENVPGFTERIQFPKNQS